MFLLSIDDNICSSWMVYTSFQSVCMYDVHLSSLATTFGLRIRVFVWVKCFHCFVCWWPVLGFIRISVYMHSLYLCTMLYVLYACIFVCICITVYVCMCIIRYLKNCILFSLQWMPRISNNSGNKLYSLKLHFCKDTENE